MIKEKDVIIFQYFKNIYIGPMTKDIVILEI